MDAGAVVPRVSAAATALAAVLRHRADGAVLEHERDRADLPAHAREGPVARGRAADHGAGDVGDVDAVGREVVRADQHLERVRVVDGSIDRYAPDQRRHGNRPHERRVRRHGVDRLRGCAHRAAADVGDGFHRGRQAFLGRPEARWKARRFAPARGVHFGIVGLDPLRVTGAAVEALAVTLLQPQPDGQVGRAALARKAVQLPLQILHQPLGLMPVAGHLGALLLQAAALAFQRALDALVDRAFPRAQALVLGLVLLVVAQRALQLGAQLLHLGHQRGDGIARRVASDAQGFHLLGRERTGRALGSGLAAGRAGEQLDADEHQQQRHRDQQPLEQRITFHRALLRSSRPRRPAAGSRWRRSGSAPAAATRPGRGRA
ncbi:hypothetical protein SDC9_111972 [bioreactor metagenome]|uniref:Uncharacterized protein n=1 Tax=bioreactor metagenome TaxID=1076179 RepID=A0A645BHY1_9ZZZZ